VERKDINPVIVGKKLPIKSTTPTIGNHLQQPVSQLMLQQHPVLNITEVIVTRTITLKIVVSRRKRI
jgi:hypothetical protein